MTRKISFDAITIKPSGWKVFKRFALRVARACKKSQGAVTNVEKQASVTNDKSLLIYVDEIDDDGRIECLIPANQWSYK